VKILIHSNAPNTKTGYGVQCALLAERLHDAGHEVAISATYGQQGSSGSWKPEHPRRPELWETGIRVYQAGWEQQGNDILHNHAMHFFGGDPLGGWIIPLLDIWALVNPLLEDFNVAAWAPVDHFPVPPGVLRFFERTGAVPVAMSKFGRGGFERAGLDPEYVPLAVDLEVYKPTDTLTHPAYGDIPARQLIGVPDEAFLVGMVAMNKDANDRKGFCEAFGAFGAFWRQHPDAVLYVHSDWKGMGTSFDLKELAVHCGVPPHAIVFPDTYAYQTGFTGEMMAAVYSSFDVLLAPSHGEGFCVPLIEAQACGTPVIVTDFSAQPELLGAGWKVLGQQQWDPAQHAFYIVPFITELVEALEAAYVADLDALAPQAIAKAQEYDVDLVFGEHWLPLLAQMEAQPEPLDLKRDKDLDSVAVLVPALGRPQNVERLVASLAATPEAIPYFICDPDDIEQIEAVEKAGAIVLRHAGTFAEKINHGVKATTQPWLMVCGDDVEFDPSWLCAARTVDGFDVIGTNDSEPGRVRNPEVAAGKHADHFLVRREYVTEYGASLDGPGLLAPEAYGHWYVDKEIVELAKARGVFTPCLASVVVHHHPGYDGREDLRQADPTYMKAVESSGSDAETYESRLPLIRMQRTCLGKSR
jgi:glycosyltransferase involved in cell wall biosynthesis